MPSRVSGLSRHAKSHPKLTIFGAVVLVAALIGSYLSRGSVILPPSSFSQCANEGYIVTDTNPPACLDGKKSFLGPTAQATPTLPPLTSQPFQVLVDGDSKGKYQRSNQVITTESQWLHYWTSVHTWISPVPVIIPVDFTQSDVLAISEGQEATTGYVYEITSVNTGDTGTVVDVSESIPTVTCLVSYTPSNRYYIVETAKLPAPVTFTVTTTRRQCP